jgi:palmitoyl transferase
MSTGWKQALEAVVIAAAISAASVGTAGAQTDSAQVHEPAIDDVRSPQHDEPQGFWSRLSNTLPVGLSTENTANASFWSRTGEGIRKSWSSGRADIMVPGYIWHAPWQYSGDQRAHYNTVPWGIGYGRTTMDANGRARTLLALVSADSFKRPQYMAAYIWRARWRPGAGALRLGAGYTALAIGRAEYHYAPVPLALPLASIGTDHVELIGTYVPGFEVGYFMARVGLR